MLTFVIISNTIIVLILVVILFICRFNPYYQRQINDLEQQIRFLECSMVEIRRGITNYSRQKERLEQLKKEAQEKINKEIEKALEGGK